MNKHQLDAMRTAWADYKSLEEQAFGGMRQAQKAVWRAYMRQETVLRETFLAEVAKTMGEFDG
jgi:hypothetical protein